MQEDVEWGIESKGGKIEQEIQSAIHVQVEPPRKTARI